MGLLDVLGLAASASTTASSRTAAPASRDDRANERAGDTSSDVTDKVVAAHDAIAELLKKLPEDKARDGLETELSALRAKHAGLADGARAAAEKAELASAAALNAKVKKLADKADQARELETTKAVVDTALSLVNAMVLSVISDDALRTAINAELTKLKAAREKAVRITDPKAALAGWTALSEQVGALKKKAEGARDASAVSRDELDPLFSAAKTAVAAGPGAAKAKLEAELAALEADRQRFLKAMDGPSLTTAVKPRLSKLVDLAKALPSAAAKVDAALARAAAALKKIDDPATTPLQDRLKALQDERAADWPAGKTIEEMAASHDRVAKGGEALAKEAEGLGPKLTMQREIAALRKRLDGLKPRLDKALVAGDSAVVQRHQKKITDSLAEFDKYEKAVNLVGCQMMFSRIGSTLDLVEPLPALIAACRARLAAAKNGGIKAALATKLEPASLAAVRKKALEAEEVEIAGLIDAGNLVLADRFIVTWLASAKTWSEAPDAYENLRSGKPKKRVMEKLIGKPGGGEVFDALVADLPASTTDTETMTTAIEARFGTKVRQFDHRNPDEKGSTATTPRTETNPDAPQKELKDLYKILTMVPAKDVAYTEKIVDYEEDAGGAVYRSGNDEWAKGGSRKDEIAMYVGRPGQPDTMVLGGTQVPGQTADANCQPADSAKVNRYTQSALHEVAHGLDDAKNVMGAHMDEAGWEAWTVDTVAKKVAGFYGYDTAYTLAVLTTGAPSTKPPKPATVKTDAEWDDARKEVERWASEMRESGKPWNNASASKNNAIGGRVIQEAYKDEWVSYHLTARARGIRAYQFRAPAEWFAELYAAFYLGKLKPQHPSSPWLTVLRNESEAS